MKSYGLSKWQIKKAKRKISFSKKFLNSNSIQIDNKYIPYAKFVANSYVNTDKYVAELQHRAWSVYEYAQERDLTNIFITLTLPSHWHAKKLKKDKLVKNKKFAGRKYITTINNIKFINAHVKQNIPFIEPTLDFSQTIDKYTPHNASKELSKMLKKFFDDRSYKGIKKEDRIYFRVTEPHTDGTPHLHISLFVPGNEVQKVIKALKRLYPAPMGKIETDIKSPISYLMKYILKTFDDLREDDENITNLTLWYVYHGICRFYTSRTFVALEIYRKLNGMYTLRDLTKEYLSEDLRVYIDTETGKIGKIENEYGVIYTPKPVNWYDKFFVEDDSWIKRPPLRQDINIVFDEQDFIIVYEQETKQTTKQKPLHKMKDYQLYQHFMSLEKDTDKYYEVRNELIYRGLYDMGELAETTYRGF